MRSWKTSLSAAVAGLAYAAQTLDLPPTVRALCQACVVLGIIAGGMFARDNDRTSEDVGAAPMLPPRILGAVPVLPPRSPPGDVESTPPPLPPAAPGDPR